MQVCKSTNQQLAQAVLASMRAGSFSGRFASSGLLPLCEPDTVRSEVQRNQDVLLTMGGGTWARLAKRQPDLALELVQQALGSANNEAALKKRWVLVRPFVAVHGAMQAQTAVPACAPDRLSSSIKLCVCACECCCCWCQPGSQSSEDYRRV